jgi:beta-glucosidase
MTTTSITTPAAAAAAELIGTLPKDFRWGVATSAYQIEGAAAEDGRTPSIWDTYCRQPGAVDNGENGDVACDHYHRMPEDVALIKGLGVDSYRFSVSWPRVQPHGRGPANPAGLGFYDRLVDKLLADGLDPWLTLYHWDLPQELEDAGGWPVRDTAYRFADFSMLVFDKLRDRVNSWTTLNEPSCSAMHGYAYALHAPGRSNLSDAFSAVHHLLLGHGLAGQRMREAAGDSFDLGITLNLAPAYPATDSPVDHEAARRSDAVSNRAYLDPLFRGSYPQDLVDDLADIGIRIPVQDGDLDVISTPLDTLGVNFYFAQQMSGTDEAGNTRDSLGRPVTRAVPKGLPQTAMGWEITPDSFTELLVRISKEYPGVPVYVTENGAAFNDKPDDSGFVLDNDRTEYIAQHLAAVAAARQQGADVRGYFVWSLFDNFEWAYGYDKRFGIIRVDFESQQRVLKNSARWYTETINRIRGQ